MSFVDWADRNKKSALVLLVAVSVFTSWLLLTSIGHLQELNIEERKQAHPNCPSGAVFNLYVVPDGDFANRRGGE